MNNLEKYNNAFVEAFQANLDELNDEFAAGKVKNWDSIRHLNLITLIEDAFDIMLDSEDLLALRSYTIGFEILAKYGIELNETK